MNKKAKGISLIVLVITIIVMIIIAGAIILSLSNTNVIAKSKEGRAKNEISLLKEQWQRAYSEALADLNGATPTEGQIEAKFGAANVPVDYDLTETGMLYTGADTVYMAAANDLGVPTGLGIGKIATVNTTVYGGAAAHNNPIIPKGFKAINDGTTWPTGWNDGLVIEDAVGNQFVWVPVDGTNVPYAKWCTIGVSYTNSSLSEDTLPTGITDEALQITANGGFYIGRYEAGNSSSTLVSKKNMTVWTSINYTDSRTKALAMYNTSEVKSGLLTGKQFDTVLKWVQNSGKSVIDDRAWANHPDSISPANVSGYATKQVTGYSEYWKAKNIYDLGGNAGEWTNEKYSSSNIWRASNVAYPGVDYPTSYRYVSLSNNASTVLSFRVVLYIV